MMQTMGPNLILCLAISRTVSNANTILPAPSSYMAHLALPCQTQPGKQEDGKNTSKQAAKTPKPGRRLPVQSTKGQGSGPSGGMGIVETWVREKPIRTFLANLSRQLVAASAVSSSAAADGEGGLGGGPDGGIPQLSPIANSVVSRCSGYGLPNRKFVPVAVAWGVEG
jgi:hypothetical protein